MADDPLENLSHEEKERLANIVKGDTSRREMLKAGGALGLGALVGGGGYAASTQNAKADASTSDADGNVGTPSNPIDVFAEGIAGGGTGINIGDSLVPDMDASYDLGSASNTWNNAHFGSVSTDRINNIAEFVCNDSAELADALSHAESNRGTKIALGDNIYQPQDNMALPAEVEDGTVIVGQHPARDREAVDGFRPESGSIVDLAGEDFLRPVNGAAGCYFDGFGVRDFGYFVKSGATDKYGMTRSEFYNIELYNFTAPFAIEMTNEHRLHLQSVHSSSGGGLYHAIQDHSTFNSGNSSFFAPFANNTQAGDVSAFKFTNLQGTQSLPSMYSPQTFHKNNGTPAGASIRVDGSANDALYSQQMNIHQGNFEADWDRGIEFIGDGYGHYLNAQWPGDATYSVYFDGDIRGNIDAVRIAGNEDYYLNGTSFNRLVITGEVDTIDGPGSATVYNAGSVYGKGGEQMRWGGQGPEVINQPLRIVGDSQNATNQIVLVDSSNNYFGEVIGNDNFLKITAIDNNGVQLNGPNTEGLRAMDGGFGVSNTSNLAGTSGDFDGQIKRDDGTNTSDGNPACCEWRGSPGVWRELGVGAENTFI